MNRKLFLVFFIFLTTYCTSLIAQEVTSKEIYFSELPSGGAKLYGYVTIEIRPAFMGGPYLKAKWKNLKITSVQYKGRFFDGSSTEFILNNGEKYIKFPYYEKDNTAQIDCDIVARFTMDYMPYDLNFHTKYLTGFEDFYDSKEADKFFKEYNDNNGLTDEQVWNTAVLQDVTINSIGGIGQEIVSKLDGWIAENGQKAYATEAKSLISNAKMAYGSNQIPELQEGLEDLKNAKSAAIKSGDPNLIQRVEDLEKNITLKIGDIKDKEFNNKMLEAKRKREEEQAEEKKKYTQYTSYRQTKQQQEMAQYKSEWEAANQLAQAVSRMGPMEIEELGEYRGFGVGTFQSTPDTREYYVDYRIGSYTKFLSTSVTLGFAGSPNRNIDFLAKIPIGLGIGTNYFGIYGIGAVCGGYRFQKSPDFPNPDTGIGIDNVVAFFQYGFQGLIRTKNDLFITLTALKSSSGEFSATGYDPNYWDVSIGIGFRR